MADQKIPKILLTGKPACGKTTVIIKLAELLSPKKLAGFYTAEIRSAAAARTGFAVHTFSGAQGPLSSIHLKHGPRVGKYRVDIPAFEKIALPQLNQSPDEVDLFIIDEIGKMECFSPYFIRAAQQILLGPAPLLATVALKGSGFIAQVKTHPGIGLIEVTPANRDTLPAEIMDQLSLG